MADGIPAESCSRADHEAFQVFNLHPGPARRHGMRTYTGIYIYIYKSTTYAYARATVLYTYTARWHKIYVSLTTWQGMGFFFHALNLSNTQSFL